MVAAYCAPEDACPGMGLGITDSGLGIQILGATPISYDADLHEGFYYDCSRESGAGQYFGWRSTRRIYTAAERGALSGSLRFPGLQVFETDTLRTLEWDGTGWIVMHEPLQTFVPAFTGITVGGGGVTLVGRSQRGGGFIDLYASVTMGVGSAPNGPVTLTLPVNIHATALGALYAATLLDAGTTQFPAQILPSAGSLSVNAINAAGTYASPAALSGAVPFAWTTSDAVIVTARYPMTSPYS